MKKTQPPPAISGTVEELEEMRQAQHEKAKKAISDFFLTNPLSLQRRAAAKRLASAEENLYNISLALEAQDAAWKAANLSTALANLARVWYPLQDLPIPAWAQEKHEAPQAADLWANVA